MPKEERTSIKFSNFVRVNEDTSSDRLKDGEIPQLENMVLDNPFGKAHIRGGFPVQNSNETTNIIDKLVDVKSSDGTNYVLAGHSTFIGRSVGSAWTNIKTGLASSFGYFRHIAFADDLIFTNGSDKPFRITGSDLTTTTNLEIASPVMDGIIIQDRAPGGDNHLTVSSLYFWMLVYVTDTGERSNPSVPFSFWLDGTALPQTTGASGEAFLFTNLPVATDGVELVTNGAFGSDASWTKGTGWTIASKVASCGGSQTADSDLTQSITLVTDAKYSVSFTISGYSAGTVTPVIDDVEGIAKNTNGRHTQVITATSSSGDIDIRANATFVGDIDDVSVQRVDERVTSKWLYRTEAWDLSDTASATVFYLVKKLDNITVQYEDALPDVDLDFSEGIVFVRTPEEAEYITESNNRVWFGNQTIRQKGFFDPVVWGAQWGSNQTSLVQSLGVFNDASTITGNLYLSADADGGSVLNGNMTVAGSWTGGGSSPPANEWDIALSVATCSGAQGADSDLKQTIAITEGQAYLVSFNLVVWTAGNITPVLGGTEGTDRTSTTQTYSEVIIAGSGGDIALRADADFIGTVDVVVVKGLTNNKYYQYMYTYIDDNDLESEPSHGEVFKISSSTTFRQITTRGYDRGSIGANPTKNNFGLIKRNIYRTEGKTDSFITGDESFYLVASETITHDSKPVTNPTIGKYDFVDTMDDVTLVTKPVYAQVTKNHKSAISWSQVDRPSYFLLENIRQIFRDDQDKITGMFDDGNGVLIFKENSIVKLYHTGASQNWYIRKIWTDFGCDEPKSMVKSGNTIYFRYQKKPYAFVSDSAPKYIGFGKQSTLDDMTVIDAVANDEWVMFACTQSSNHFVLVYDKKINTWYQFNFSTNDLTALLVKRYSDFWITNNLYIGLNKKIYDYDESSTFDDVSGSNVIISPVIKFPRIQLDDTTKAKLRGVVLGFDRSTSDNVGLILTRDTGDDSSINIPNSGGEDGILRITGFGGKPASDFFDIKLTAGMIQVDSLRADLRPVKRGLS